jgi:hypothetical protein
MISPSAAWAVDAAKQAMKAEIRNARGIAAAAVRVNCALDSPGRDPEKAGSHGAEEATLR